jgi:hypothetical protein
MATPSGHYDLISPRYLPRRPENGGSGAARPSAASIPITSTLVPKLKMMEKREEGGDALEQHQQPRMTTSTVGVDESGEFVLAHEIVRVLSAGGLDKYTEIFTQEEIDLESFLMLNDADLRNMNIPTGT